YEHPTVLVIYRDDYRFLLDEVIPKRGAGQAEYDMVIASQPYRARAPLEIKQKVWPGENPFIHTRHDLMRAAKAELGREARRYNFNAYADARAIFRYDMHTLPSEISSSIGTSTLFAAWNAAIYVAQIEDQRLGETLKDSRYLDA